MARATSTTTHANDAHGGRKDWSETFTALACKIAHLMGKPAAFLTACALVIVWAASGPLFGFSDTWQLVINTSTTIITFLMVFIIQNSQNRDTAAMQIKLDELIIRLEGAREELLDLEELDEEDLVVIRRDFCKRASKARRKAEDGSNTA